jgi:hypothetical protein
MTGLRLCGLIRTASCVVVAANAVACGGGSTVGAAPVTNTGPAQGLRFRAEASIVVGPRPSDWRYMRLVASVHNAGVAPVPVTLRMRCPVVAVIYRTADHRKRPAWRQDWQVGGCKSIPRTLTLPSDSTLTLSTSVATRNILGDSLRARIYYVSALVGIAEGPGGSVEILAGPIQLTP